MSLNFNAGAFKSLTPSGTLLNGGKAAELGEVQQMNVPTTLCKAHHPDYKSFKAAWENGSLQVNDTYVNEDGMTCKITRVDRDANGKITGLGSYVLGSGYPKGTIIG